jgi:hypothetical protein
VIDFRTSDLRGPGFQQVLNEIRGTERLRLKARARLFLLPARSLGTMFHLSTHGHGGFHKGSRARSVSSGNDEGHGWLYSLTDNAVFVPRASQELHRKD